MAKRIDDRDPIYLHNFRAGDHLFTHWDTSLLKYVKVRHVGYYYFQTIEQVDNFLENLPENFEVEEVGDVVLDSRFYMF